MPCANAVARSCVRPVANAVDAISGLSRPPGSLIFSDFMSGLGGADQLLNIALLGPQYQDGVLVGLQPACDDLAFAGLVGIKGMRTEGNITNILPAGAEDFSTGWTYQGSRKVDQAIVALADSGQHAIRSTNNIVGVGTYYVAIDAEFSGYSLQILVSGSSSMSYINYDLQNGLCYNNGAVNAGIIAKQGGGHICWAVITCAAVGLLYFAPTNSANPTRYPSFTGDGVSGVRLKNPLVALSSYPVPYIPPGVTQTSTAHNGTSGIHYSMPQNGAIWNQLSTAKPLTIAARIVPGVGSEEIPNSTTLNIRTCRSDPSRLLRVVKDSSGNCRVELHDGTNTAQSPIITWSRYQQLIVVGQVLNGGLQMRAGAKVGAGALSFGSAVTYAGSFGPDAVYSKLMLAHSNVYPVHTLKDWLADYQSSEADILAAMGVA